MGKMEKSFQKAVRVSEYVILMRNLVTTERENCFSHL